MERTCLGPWLNSGAGRIGQLGGKRMIYKQITASLKVKDIASDIPVIQAGVTVFDACAELGIADAITGIVEQGGRDIGYIDFGIEWETTDALVESWMVPIPSNEIVSRDLAIANLVPLFADNYFYFVLCGNRVTGIVSYSDLDKLPFKLAFFSLLMALESELASGIRNGEKGVDHYLSLLPPSRREKARKVLRLREEYSKRGAHRDIVEQRDRLLECTCFADRAKIWLKDPGLTNRLSFPSKSDARSFLNLAERLRNQIAHGNSILEVFPTPEDLIEFLQTLEEKTKVLSSGGTD
ncbi:MAG: hypothetical protein ACFFCW_37795 [Candidatus Hodarchaeota archaeon]